jgi:hypothetical protein
MKKGKEVRESCESYDVVMEAGEDAMSFFYTVLVLELLVFIVFIVWAWWLR